MKKSNSLFSLAFISFFIINYSLLITNCKAQWVQTNGPSGSAIYNIAVSGDNIFAGTEGSGIFRSTDNGMNWIQVNNGLTNLNVNTIAVTGNNIFIGTGASGSGGVFLSTNNGNNWIPVNNNFPNSTVQSIVINNDNIFAGTEGAGVYLSTNNGSNWVSRNSGLTDPDVFTVDIGNGAVYAGTWGGGVFKSTNNGLNWINTGLSSNYVDIIKINGSNIFAGLTFGGGAYLSTNNGVNWLPINSGLPSNSSIHEYAINGSYVFTGTSNGVFLTSNNGTNWISINQGIGNPTVLSLASNNLYVFAGTYSNGIWRRLLSNITGVEKHTSEIANNFLLSQNYPNPFNPTTNIRYNIPKNGFVKLIVFDALGREVETLVNEKQSAGTYEATFEGASLTSGIYFYRLTADGYSDTKRMLMIK